MPAVAPAVVASPDRRLAWLQAVLGAAVVAAVPVADPAGRLLLIAAGAVLVVLAGRDLLLRPVLAADAGGLRVVDGWTTRALPWSQVHGLRVVTDRRAPLLELDLGVSVVVLSRRRLGRAPDVVLDELRALVP